MKYNCGNKGLSQSYDFQVLSVDDAKSAYYDGEIVVQLTSTIGKK